MAEANQHVVEASISTIKRELMMGSENVPSKKIKNLFSSNELLYLRKEGADVGFTLKGSDEIIPAHKIILKKVLYSKQHFTVRWSVKMK